MLINEAENKFALFPHHCKYWWDTFAWRFDPEFQKIRRDIGYDTHIVHFHSSHEIIVLDDYGHPSISYHPIIQFHHRSDLVRFRLMLPG